MDSSTPHLFSPLDPADPEAPTLIGGRCEAPVQLAASFLEAADLLAVVWRAEREDDNELPIALPIIQTYRHAIELILKYQCLEIRRLQIFGLRMGYGTKTGPDDLETKLGKLHSIASVIGVLNKLMAGLDVDEQSSQLPDRVTETLAFLHDQDARGLAFRYSTQQVPGSKPAVSEPVRPNETYIYLESAITRLHNAAELLTDGLGGYLDAYEEALGEAWHYYKSEVGYCA